MVRMLTKPKRVSEYINWLKYSAWTFPLGLALLVILLTTLRISGTSVGAYHQALYGDTTRDPNLLYGHPRAIRSDEWLSTTQMIVSQSKNEYPIFNKDLQSGRSVALSADLPAKDWAAVFKPQNWSFFVLPLEYAFAFKWWLLMYLLIVACYFFVLRVLPGQRLFAALFSTAIGIAPFELWWYQSGAYLSLAYGFMMAILIMRILNGEPARFVKNRTWSISIYVLVLAFILSCFGLIIYPPFQIPIAIVVGFFGIGCLLHNKFEDNLGLLQLSKRVGLITTSVALAGVVVGIFMLSNRAPVQALSDTVYPGARATSSGDLKLLKVFNSFMMPPLQSDLRGSHFIGNQSEDSNFILLLPFLLIPGFILMVYEYIRKRGIDWVFLSFQLVGLMFLTRMFVHFGDSFYKLLLLERVPNERLVIGLGFVGILQSVYLLKKLGELNIRQWTLVKLSAIYSFACLLLLLAVGGFTIKHYPLFINRWLEVIVLATAFSAIIFLWIANRRFLAVAMFLMFTVASSFRIIPLYRGLGFANSSVLASQMQAISNSNDSWGTIDLPLFQNMGLLADRRSFTGTEIYPDMDFWRQVGGTKYDYIFNRQAHVMLADDRTMQEPARLVIGNFFELKFDCTDFIKKNVNFVLSPHPITYKCANLKDTVRYPKMTLYLYRVSP